MKRSEFMKMLPFAITATTVAVIAKPKRQLGMVMVEKAKWPWQNPDEWKPIDGADVSLNPPPQKDEIIQVLYK